MILHFILFIINISIREAHIIMGETTTSSNNSNSTHAQPVPCSMNESQIAQCLNGGECFKPFADVPFFSCNCPVDFEGENCANRVLPIFDTIFSNKIYLVLISLTLASILISIVVFVSLALIKKRRRDYTPCTEERQNLK